MSLAVCENIIDLPASSVLAKAPMDRVQVLEHQGHASRGDLFQPVPPSCSVPRRRRRSRVSAGQLEDEVVFQLPNLRKRRSLVDQVELRRLIFQEARAHLRQTAYTHRKVLSVLSPFEKIRAAANAILRATHGVIIQNNVVSIWKGAVAKAKDQLSNDRQVNDEVSTEVAGSTDGLFDMGLEGHSIDTLLAEFEIMSDHIPCLKESKDFQRNAQRLIGMVHISISTLVNLHDSASRGITDSDALRSKFSDQAIRAQELWDKIKDDVARIQKLLHPQCDNPPVEQEVLSETAPTPFLKVVEHQLESLGVIREVCAKRYSSEVEHPANCNDEVAFNAELFAALGGGSYQRLVDWGDSMAKIRSSKGERARNAGEQQITPEGGEEEQEDGGEFAEHLLRFLDECKESSSESQDILAGSSTISADAPTRIALTEEHVLTGRRFHCTPDWLAIHKQDDTYAPLHCEQSLASSHVDPLHAGPELVIPGADQAHSLITDLRIQLEAVVEARPPDSALAGSDDTPDSASSANSDMKSNIGIELPESIKSPPCPCAPSRRVRFCSRPGLVKNEASAFVSKPGWEHRRLHKVDGDCESLSVVSRQSALLDQSCVKNQTRRVDSTESEMVASPTFPPSPRSSSQMVERLASQQATLSHRGRRFSRGQSPNGESLLVAKPPTERFQPHEAATEYLSDSDEDEDSYLPSRRSSLSAVSSLGDPSLSVHSLDTETCRRSDQGRPSPRKLRVRGRSINKSGACFFPPTDHDAEHMMKVNALHPSGWEDDDASTTISSDSSRCRSTSRSVSSSRNTSKSSVKLPSVLGQRSPRGSAVLSPVTPAALCSRRSPDATEKAMSKWTVLKNSLNLPALVGRRPSASNKSSH